SFDPLTDLMPVTEVARIHFLLAVPSSLPVSSVPELIAYAKAHPGELNFGSSGNGSPQRLMTELFQLTTGIKMNHVPYKGAAPVLGRSDVKSKLEPQGIELVTNPPTEFAKLIHADYVKWGKVIKEANIRGE